MPKTIIISGASNGVGAAAVHKLHQDRHRVIVVSRSPAKTESVTGGIGLCTPSYILRTFQRSVECL